MEVAEDRRSLWLLAGSGKAGTSCCRVKHGEAQPPHRISGWGAAGTFGGTEGLRNASKAAEPCIAPCECARVPHTPHRSHAGSAFSESGEQRFLTLHPPQTCTRKGRVMWSRSIGAEAHPGFGAPQGPGGAKGRSRCSVPLPGAAREAGSGTGPER